MANDKYLQRGVSADKHDVHKAIEHLDKGLFPNAFCKILPDVAQDDGFVNVMHADTAGTKTSLAYLYWKETGNIDVWKGIVQDAIVMNVDDMACVGICDQILLSSTIGRNKHLIPGIVLNEIIAGATQFCDSMRDLGINVKMAGGETADVGDIVRTIDIGYTTFARWPKQKLVLNDIQPGQVVVGFASSGQTTYESNYNSGIGSNGLTSARHDLLHKSYAVEYPESVSPETNNSVVYTGPYKLTDQETVQHTSYEIGRLLLSPTRTYLPLLKTIFDQGIPLDGLIHCTGGGQTKVGKFIHDGVSVVKNDLFEMPPIFELIHRVTETPHEEMYKVFNMGHRLEAYVNGKYAADLISIANTFNISAKVIGYVDVGSDSVVLKMINGTVIEYRSHS